MISPLSNTTGKQTDWWFAYKLPIDIGPKNDSSGFEFLYMDADSAEQLELSSVALNDASSALSLTLNQIFSDRLDAGFILWNDEIPPSSVHDKPQNNENCGHSKGILAFSKKTDSGFYLLHSTPRFPLRGMPELPEDERKYGQTYLCVSFKNYQTANDIAQVLLSQNEVQVYDSSLPDIEEDEYLWKLAKSVKQPIPEVPAKYVFETLHGVSFQLLAKNKKWSEPTKTDAEGKDFWEDLIAPTLGCDLSVETWRRGLVFEDADSISQDITHDVLHINLSQLGLQGYSWPFTKDHAKWGVSDQIEDAVVIIADINRQVSQRKRGGGGLVFKVPALCRALRMIETPETSVEKSNHIDKF